MSTYEIARDGMEKLLPMALELMGSFNRKNYMTGFKAAYERSLPAFDAIEELYGTVLEPESLAANMAGVLVESAKSRVEQAGNRRKQSLEKMNLNMALAVFVYPAILHYDGKSSQPLCDAVGVLWKEAFPESNVSPAKVEHIEKGFQRKFCYITTAVCKTLGKPDNCYELQLFRQYRDGWLEHSEGGREMVAAYYDVAPSIVKHIGQEQNADQIYRGIWNQYLKPCMKLIEDGDNEGCRELYRTMVEDLKAAYFRRRR